MTSVVIIISLEITGVPDTTYPRKYPWPKPKFVEPPRSESYTFDVSLFSNGEVEFLLPEALYVWRLASLEEIIRKERRIDGLMIHTYYDESEGNEDDDKLLVPYPGEIVCAKRACEEESHFENSGYNVLTVRFPHNDNYDSMCVWEVSPAAGRYNGPRPHTLDRDQKAAMQKIIDDLQEDADINLYFSLPVDCSRYVDYLNMIEVPMDLSFIRKRLKNDYYSNILSVRSDMRLIRDNCFKYNESDSAISITANEMFERFIQLFDEVEKSVIGQSQPFIDRHFPLIPEEDEAIDILFETTLETALPLAADAMVVDSTSPLRTTRSSSAMNNAVLPRTENYTRPRRSDRSRSAYQSNRPSDRPFSGDEIQTWVGRPNTRSHNAHQRSNHIDARNTGRLSRTSYSDQAGNTGSAYSRPGGDNRNSRHIHSSPSDNLSSGRHLRSMGAARSSIWDTGQNLSSNSTVIRIRLTPTRGRTSNHVPATNLDSAVISPTTNTDRISRIRTRSSAEYPPSVLSPSIQATNRSGKNIKSSRRINRPFVKYDDKPTRNTVAEDEHSAKSWNRSGENKRVSRSRLVAHSPSVLINISSTPFAPDPESKRITRSSNINQSQLASIDGKKRKASTDLNLDLRKSSTPTRTKYPAKKSSKIKTRSKIVENENDSDGESNNSIEVRRHKRTKSRVEKTRERISKSDWTSYLSSEEDSHSARRSSRKTSGKKISYKESSDEYGDETENDDTDMDERKLVARRNLPRKRGRTFK
jgi:hypothetical protein